MAVDINQAFVPSSHDEDAKLLSKYQYANVKKHVESLPKLAKVLLPFPSLNNIFEGGLEEESLWIIGGLPGAGKTTFVNQLMEEMSHKHKTLSISLEMSDRKSIPQIEKRGNRNENNLFTAYDLKTIGEIEALIKAFKRANEGEVFIAIDYLQKIGHETITDDKQRLDDIITRIKQLTKEFSGMRILLISSMNSDAFTGGMRQGVFSGSRAIEYEVDISSAFVYVGEDGKIIKDMSNFDDEQSRKIRRALYFVKNRQGNIHTKAIFTFDKYSGQLVDSVKEASCVEIEYQYNVSSMGTY